MAAFVLPGFVALKYRERTYIVKADDTPFERLLSALYYSFLSYLVLGVIVVVILGASTADVRRLWRGEVRASAYVALAAAGVVIPTLLAEIARWWAGSRLRGRVQLVAGLNSAHTTPSGWEHFFLSDRTCFVRVTLSDARVVAGRFGDGSFAGYTAETPDLYLEERWTLDDNDWFAERVAGSLGVYVRAEEIVSVEFYDDGDPRLPALAWWRRLKCFSFLASEATRTLLTRHDDAPAPDTEDRRDQSLAASSESPDAAPPA